MSRKKPGPEPSPASALVIHWLGARGSRAAQRIWRAEEAKPEVTMLRPLSAAFGALTRARRSAYARGVLKVERAAIPVISVGNLTVGGTGKTPFSRWLTERLLERGQRPAILHRGYGSDEPALHRLWHPEVPVFVGSDRVESVKQAERAGATVVVLDDGFQHLRLARDLDIVLISADNWHLPKRLLPAGNWREPISVLQDANAVVITRKAASAATARTITEEVKRETRNALCAIAALSLGDFVDLRDAARKPPPKDDVVALCAIADPSAFATQLGATGLRVAELFAFDDHHEYTRHDLQLVKTRARGRAIVTTEKDAVKIRAIDPAMEATVVGQNVKIEEGETALLAAVQSVLR